MCEKVWCCLKVIVQRKKTVQKIDRPTVCCAYIKFCNRSMFVIFVKNAQKSVGIVLHDSENCRNAVTTFRSRMAYIVSQFPYIEKQMKV